MADSFTARGLPTDPAQVVVTSGAVSAWSLLLRVLTQPGDRVLVEQVDAPDDADGERS